MVFGFLSLIEDTKYVVFNRVVFLLDDLAAIQTFPALKINKMIKEGLHYH